MKHGRPLADMPVFKAFSAARLRDSYVLALLLLAAYAFAAYLISEQVVATEGRSEAYVRIADDQRMLSQRAALLAHFYVIGYGPHRAYYHRQLSDIIDQFDRAHRALIRGDVGAGTVTKPSTAVQRIYYNEPVHLDRTVRTFSRHIRALLRAKKAQLNEDNPDLQSVLFQQKWLLDRLNILVDQFSAENAARVRTLQQFEAAALTAALVTLLLVALFIFRPLELDLRRAATRLRHLAVHDALTGLPNRRLLYDRATVALAHAKRTQGKVAVMFLDLDGFKAINDSEGHRIGDLVLQEATRRMVGCLRVGDTMARLDGDEFVFLLPEIDSGAGDVARRLGEALSAPLVAEGRALSVTCSIGISSYPSDGLDIEALIRSADIAMYRAKALGRNNYQYYGRLDPRAGTSPEIGAASPVA